MAGHRKLGRPTDQRMALLRGQVTELINNGRIETTLTRGKEVQSIAEKLITIAIRECDNTTTVTKNVQNEKAQTVEETFTIDTPSRLAARRQLMQVLYKVPAKKLPGEKDDDFEERIEGINHVVIEKLFREIGPKFKKRNEEKNAQGGYTRLLKMGPRRGDAAEMVILEII